MTENKVYEAKSKRITWGSVVLFLFGAFGIVKSLVVMVNTGAYDAINYMWVFKELFSLYFCFVALNLAPQKVEFLENELVRITYLLGNSITIKQEQFKFTEMNGSKKGWTGCLMTKGRTVFFTSDTFPELEKYLIQK